MQAVIDYLHRNTVPLVSSALAAVLALAFWRLGPLVPFLLFLGAVVASAWWGGFRPALLAIVLASVLLALMYRNMAKGTLADSPQQFLFRLGAMSGIALLAGLVGQQCRTAIRSMTRAQDMLSGSGLGMIATDVQGRVVSINARATELTGWAVEAARGLALGDVLHVVEGGSARRRVSVPVEALLESPARMDLPEGAVLVGQMGQEVAIDGSVASLAGGGGAPVGVVATFRDVGGRIQALQELRTQAERSQALVAQAAAPLMLVDDEGRCTFANAPAQQVLGCTAEECQGEGWARHMQRQDRAQLFAEAPAALRKRQTYAREVRVQHPRQGVRWVRLATTPVSAPGGSNGTGLLGHSVVLEDLSLVKQAEARVEEQARLTDAVLEAVEDPVLVKNHLGAAVAMNAAARALLGVEEGVTGSEALAFDDSQRLTEAERTARATRQRQTADLTVTGEEGSRLFQAVAVPRSDDKGDVVGTVNVLREVTGAREKERQFQEAVERLQALAENVPGFLYLKDQEGRFVLANRDFEEMAGCEPGAWRGRRDEEVLPAPLAAALRKQEKALNGETDVRQAMETLPHGDERGSYLVRRFRVAGGADGGEWLGAVGVDLTGHRRSAEEVRAERDALAGRLKDLEARQKEEVESLRQELRTARQELEATGAARRRAQEELARAREDGFGRAELQRQLEETRAERVQAEEALRQREEQHAVGLREERDAHQRAEEEWKRVRQELQHQLEEAVTARLLMESSLAQGRREQEAKLREAVQGRDEAEHKLRRVGSESLAEQARLMAGCSRLAEQLGKAREELEQLQAEKDGLRHLTEEEWRKREEPLLAERRELEARLREAQDRQVLAERTLRQAAGESLAEQARLQVGQCRTGDELHGVRGELQTLLARTHGKRLFSEEEWRQLLAERDGEWEKRLEELRRRLEQVEAARLSLEGQEASLRQQVNEARRALREAEAKGQVERQAADEARLALRQAESAWQTEREQLAGAGEAVRGDTEAEARRLADLRGQLADVGQALEAVRQEKDFLAAVLDGLPEAVAAYDGAGRCRVWNALMERWSGTARQAMLGQASLAGFPASAATALQSGLQTAMAGGSRRVPLEGPSFDGAEGERPAEVLHVPVRAETGARLGGMAVVRARVRMAAPVPVGAAAEPLVLTGSPRNGAKNGNGSHPERLDRGDPARVPSPDDPDWLSFN